MVDKWDLTVTVNLWAIGGLILAALWLMWLANSRLPGFRPEKVELRDPWGMVAITLRRSPEVVRLAHEAWTEISTRKAALPFDEEHDVIVEIYDSWYELFARLRRITRAVPAEQLRSSADARQLVNVLVDLLNVGLRPHLTRWQARYRTWWDAERNERPSLEPQVAQRTYPDYEELIADLRAVGERLRTFNDSLHSVAQGKKDN